MKYYKEIIKDILKNKNIINKKDMIKGILIKDYNSNKLTKEEYIELMNFVKQELKEIELEAKSVKQQENDNKVKKFKKSMQLDVMIMHQGKIGVVSPGRPKISKRNNNEKQMEEK